MPDKLEPLALSKREHFAALILAGISSNPSIDNATSLEDLARVAIGQADELIKLLAATEEVDEDPESVALDELREEYLRPKDSTESVFDPD